MVSWSSSVFMATGEPLFNNAYDMLSGLELKQLYEWTEPFKRIKLSKIKNELVRDLVSCMLLRSPSERCSMAALKEHPFYLNAGGGTMSDQKLLKGIEQKIQKIHEDVVKQTDSINRQTALLNRIDERTIRVENLTRETFSQIRRTEQVLLRGMFEATDVKVPTSFMIVDRKLTKMFIAREGENGALGPFKWLDQLVEFGTAISDSVNIEDGVPTVSPGMAMSRLKSFLFQSSKSTEYYFYLVDEHTWLPVIPDDDDSNYPIKIESPPEFIPVVLPFLKIGMKAACVVNGVAGVARMLGYPVPCVPDEYLNKAKSFVGRLDQKSSAAEFSVVQNVADDVKARGADSGDGEVGVTESTSSSSKKSVRGHALRELERFICDADADSNFCGLRRLVTSEGFSCWTMEENVEEMQRAGREAEECFFRKKLEPSNLMEKDTAATDTDNAISDVAVEVLTDVRQTTKKKVEPRLREVAMNPLQHTVTVAKRTSASTGEDDGTNAKLEAMAKELRALRKAVERAAESKSDGGCCAIC
jgi:hypothetical protein